MTYYILKVAYQVALVEVDILDFFRKLLDCLAPISVFHQAGEKYKESRTSERENLLAKEKVQYKGNICGEKIYLNEKHISERETVKLV